MNRSAGFALLARNMAVAAGARSTKAVRRRIITLNATQHVGPDQFLDSLVDDVARIFAGRYGHQPEFIVAAPGRVNLIGEHIDYNDGFVMPMAITRYVVMAASLKCPDSPESATIYSANLDQEATLCPTGRSPVAWACYLEGVLAGFRHAGITLPPFRAVIGSNIPLGGGLSSSAALEVATATLLECIGGVTLAPVEKALLCQRAEHLFAGTPCGIMDQFSSVFGQEDVLLKIDCRSMAVEGVPFSGDNAVVLITDSGVKHSLADSAYAERRQTCDSTLKKLGFTSWRDVAPHHLSAEAGRLTPVEFRRARHVVSEIARTQDAATAFQQRNWQKAGEYMYASHDSLRDDYEVSCPELDILVTTARDLGADAGVYGSRMTGGGFGGSTVTLMHSSQVDTVMKAIVARYQDTTGIRASAFVTRAARGAHVIRHTTGPR